MAENIYKNIVLIGMPGCGKTTIGKLLAERLNMKFCDIDKYIEEKEGRSVSDIFKKGEEFFRSIENKAVKEVSKNCPLVISTGGGVIKLAENIELLKKNGLIIFIDRSVEDIISDVDTSTRPLLKDGKEKIYNLYKERYILYKKYCDCEIKNDTTLKIVIDRIVACLNRHLGDDNFENINY
ncbi:shikimate kinase [Crassaminicella thermophila]|uniref:Shikimate kinase n=1 Tax=Crassaminicella thermophila TaxID=2599308 RepID=A0A5C0SC77_CRATE|nr:shikimate kinase [Crassaminicella thermophila]QEK11771.1 shikimate kinase [Crassaminicella thermophila]